MISDDERKKAVKFLRERECVKLDCHECYQMSEMVLGSHNALCVIDEQWGALADLIDRPTCRNVYDEVYDEYEAGCCENGFKCSKCGELVEDCEGYRVKGTFNFCPNCGAEVVE